MSTQRLSCGVPLYPTRQCSLELRPIQSNDHACIHMASNHHNRKRALQGARNIHRQCCAGASALDARYCTQVCTADALSKTPGLSGIADESLLVEPMTSAAGADEALQLVGLHPNELVYSLVAPDLKALSSEFHGTPCVQMRPINCRKTRRTITALSEHVVHSSSVLPLHRPSSHTRMHMCMLRSLH